MDFKDADPTTLFIVSVAVVGITLAIFYYLVKAAVKNGILEAEEAKRAKTETPSEQDKE